ncbi:MAG: AMP-binding protein [bacterium]|nr:AMP-binding protein [bacterium]
MNTTAEHTPLVDLMRYLSLHSAFYQDLFKKNGIDPLKIKTISDLQKIPFTHKADLQTRQADFVCVPRNKLIDHVSTSGTSGKPITLSLTESDLERLAENESNSFKIAGIHADDIIQLMCTIDRRFMAGLAYFLGARKLGAGIIRVGNGLPELQWTTIEEMKPTVLIAVPSFLNKMIHYAEANHIDLKKTSVKKVICIGEAIRHADNSLNALGRKITEKWPLQLFSTYASTEMSSAFTECEYSVGGHHQENLIIVELVDENGRVVKEGEPGELVVTPLGVEGMPLLRFKTGDICMAHSEPCKCGRKGLRLSPLLGRKNQMIKLKGTSLYPAAVYDILESHAAIKNYQIVIDSNELGTDEITIFVGLDPHENLFISEITDTFRAKLRVVPKLSVLSPDQVHKLLFPGNSRKAQKFIDNRANKLEDDTPREQSYK